MKEIWKDIEGYEGLYQVSNLGRVKRLKGKYRKSERILKQGINKQGYLLVCLCKDNTHKMGRVHRLVAQAFIPNSENKPQVNHIDEDKTNNNVDNIEWMTAKENNNHGSRNVRSAISKGTKIKAIDIATGECNEYYSIHECARELGLSHSNILKYLKGKLRHVGGYVFEYAK